MAFTAFWKRFKEQYPFTAIYVTMCFLASIGMLIIFIFTHGQSRVGVDEDMKRIACIHAYGYYDAARDTCIIRN